MKRWRGERLNQPYWKLSLNRDWQKENPPPAAATSSGGLLDMTSLLPPSTVTTVNRTVTESELQVSLTDAPSTPAHT